MLRTADPVDPVDPVDTAPVTPTEMLARVRSTRAAAMAAEAGLLVLAAEWADAHPDLDHDPDDPDAERGIPGSSWAAAAPFTAALGRCTASGEALIRDALVLRHRLPSIWAQVGAGGLKELPGAPAGSLRPCWTPPTTSVPTSTTSWRRWPPPSVPPLWAGSSTKPCCGCTRHATLHPESHQRHRRGRHEAARRVEGPPRLRPGVVPGRRSARHPRRAARPVRGVPRRTPRPRDRRARRSGGRPRAPAGPARPEALQAHHPGRPPLSRCIAGCLARPRPGGTLRDPGQCRARPTGPRLVRAGRHPPDRAAGHRPRRPRPDRRLRDRERLKTHTDLLHPYCVFP